MKIIVSEGRSDAQVIQKLIELLQQEKGTKQGIRLIRYLDQSKAYYDESKKDESKKSSGNAQEILNENGINIIYTRGNTHLYNLVEALLDQYQDKDKAIKILLVYDLDSSKSESYSKTQKLTDDLHSLKKELQEEQSQGYLDCFTFQEDLEGFLIEYLESNRPDWYHNVRACTEQWLGCLNAKTVFSDWKSNKNKEALLRLIYQAQYNAGAHYGLFPESFFECFEWELAKINNTKEGKALLKAINKFIEPS